MKKLLLLLPFVVPLLPAQIGLVPNCQFTYTLTNRTTETPDGKTIIKVNAGVARTPSINNITTQCNSWYMTVAVDGFSVISLELDDSQNAYTTSGGTPLAWNAWQGTINTGLNPTTTTGSSSLNVTGFYPWMSVNLASSTGTGSIYVTLYGWKTPTLLANGSGGGSVGATGIVDVASGSNGGFLASTCSIASGTLTCPGDGAFGTVGTAGAVVMGDTSTNSVTLSVPNTLSATYQLNFPAAAPSGGQVLNFPTPSSSISQATWYTPLTLIAKGLTAANGAGSINNIGSIATGTSPCPLLTISATGADPAQDSIAWNPYTAISTLTGFVPATTGGLSIASFLTTDNINFEVCNWTGGSVTPGQIRLKWSIIR